MREAQFTGGGRTVNILLDANTIAKMGSGERLELSVSPGEHYLSAALPDFVSENEEVIRFTAKPGSRYYFYYSLARELYAEKVFKFVQLSEQAGAKELATGKYKLLNR